MKISLNCSQCLAENGLPTLEFQLMEVNEAGVYISTCSRGHRTLTHAPLLKYEFLLDAGFLALKEGYPREAIANFAAAVERFYEFYVRVISLKFGIKKTLYDELLRQAYLSERQLGAFIAMYMIAHPNQNEIPQIDNSKPDIDGVANKGIKVWKNFRNDVIHNGYIPTSKEALAYGKLVYDYLFSLCEDLIQQDQENFNAARTEGLTKNFKNEENLPVSGYACPSILVMGRIKDATFESTLVTFYQTHEHIKHLAAYSQQS